ncbi:hypothetical protein ACV3ZT_08555 [Clostridium perfringens]|uniref:hypothetical protein n=1 Tax=Clostridium perfringens TaxID=1502 RepID=UPI0013A62BC2|nr:hypothetical protein [Clostridium perfringens]EGT2192658.1 hypothetical protein [Clostridium perfringens]ELP5182812.1 hypothetical protein [Clostridium perfringens]ELP5185364.1 hypothetical protein [Clostridium perfringens]ELP5188112.1 hypothetical protein [Clostridium perfringens]MBI5995883.1 hypothetical protein [Clostridium perfringens]
MDKKQKRFNISFKENEKEVELYNWIRNKSDIAPISTIIKEILYKAMNEEKEGRN